MKRKNLEKAIIMGLLAASISVPVWAAEGLWDNANIYEVVEEGDLTVDTAGPGIGYNGTVNVVNGDLIVNSDGNGIAAGWMENATLNIYANNVNITSGSNGIFTVWGDATGWIPDDVHLGNVIIGDPEDRKINSLTIVANGQGIDDKKGSVAIYGSSGSIIDIYSKGTQGETDNQSAVNSGREKDGGTNGNTFIQGGTIKLTADMGSGIITRTDASSTVIDAANSVKITSKNTDGNEKIENAGITNMAGITRVEAVNEITIDSTNHGIYATGGIVTLNSKKNTIYVNDIENNNDINGIYLDKNGQVDITSTENDLKIKVETEKNLAHGINVGSTSISEKGGNISDLKR